VPKAACRSDFRVKTQTFVPMKRVSNLQGPLAQQASQHSSQHVLRIQRNSYETMSLHRLYCTNFLIGHCSRRERLRRRTTRSMCELFTGPGGGTTQREVIDSPENTLLRSLSLSTDQPTNELHQCVHASVMGNSDTCLQ